MDICIRYTGRTCRNKLKADNKNKLTMNYYNRKYLSNDKNPLVHACNDGHMTVYEELYFSNDIAELSEGGEDKINPKTYGTVSW